MGLRSDKVLKMLKEASEVERQKKEIEMLKEGIKKLCAIPEGESKIEIVNRLRDPNEQAEAYTSTLCEDAADLIEKLYKDNENISGLLKESYEEDARKHKEIERLRLEKAYGEDIIQSYKAQVDHQNDEIKRLRAALELIEEGYLEPWEHYDVARKALQQKESE